MLIYNSIHNQWWISTLVKRNYAVIRSFLHWILNKRLTSKPKLLIIPHYSSSFINLLKLSNGLSKQITEKNFTNACRLRQSYANRWQWTLKGCCVIQPLNKIENPTATFDPIDGIYRIAANRIEKTAINKIKYFHQINSHFQTMNGNERQLEMPKIVNISQLF
jgi:hypothetical protein